MNRFLGLLEEHVDFHFILALIAIFGVAGYLYVQFAQADVEFETLNGSMYSVVRVQKTMDEREGAILEQHLDQIENELSALNLN